MASKFNAAALAALNEELGESADDLTNPSTSSGRPLPDPGATRLRMVRYIELGTHTTDSNTPKGKKKVTAPRVEVDFELSGPKHAPMEFDGEKVPHILTVRATKGNNVKSGYIKLFKALTKGDDAVKNYVQLLGGAFRGEVQHREFNKSDGSKGKSAHLGSATDGFTVQPVTYEDPETGETRKVKVDEPLTDLAIFLWDHPSLDQWDSLFIDGTWDNGDTKNKYQEVIKRAEDFKGSPIYNLLIEAGREEEIELGQFNTKKPAEKDPLGDAEQTQEDAEASAKAEAVASAAAKKAAAAAKAAVEAKEESEVKKPKATKPKAQPKAEPEEQPDDGGDDDEEAQMLARLEAIRKQKAAAAKKAAADTTDPLAD